MSAASALYHAGHDDSKICGLKERIIFAILSKIITSAVNESHDYEIHVLYEYTARFLAVSLWLRHFLCVFDLFDESI